MRVIAGVFFVAIIEESWYNKDANNPSCDFSNSKAFADKTVEAFFIFARNFEMAIGDKLNSS